jgi:hemoglobin
MTDTRKLYFKYGSRITDGAAELFYDRVYDDPALATFFQKIEKHAMQEHIANFLTGLTGGPEEYRGRNLKTAHAAYQISNDHFNALLTHLRASIEEVGVTADDAAAVMAEIEKERSQIVKA